MIEIAALRPRVAMEAPNCPNPVIDRAIVDAARELCNAASIWRDVITLNANSDGAKHDLLLPTQGEPNGEMARLIDPGVSVNGRPFHSYRMLSRHTIQIIRAPDEAVAVHVSARPMLGAQHIPDAVGSDYEDGVIAGALYRVLRNPADIWSQPNQARYYNSQFRYWRTTAIASANRDFDSSHSLRAKSRPFARFRS